MVYYKASRLRSDTEVEGDPKGLPTTAYFDTPTPRIPPELFHPIVSYISSRSTLCTLCRTSQTLRHYAEMQLYACIPISDASNAPLHIGFLRTITRTPRLARLVREYHSLSIVVHQENPIWDLTKAAFRAMSGLKVLIFRGFGGHPSGELLDMGGDGPSTSSFGDDEHGNAKNAGVVSFQLEKLHWGNHSDEQFMERILIQQRHTLRELAFECRPRSAPFPPTACPNLTVLSGNRAAIEALLPGRSITRLAWVPELDDSNADPVVGLEEELGRVRTLSFGGYFSRPRLELIVGFLRGLEVLELVGLCPGEFALLKTLPALRELVFSLRWGIAQFPIPLNGRAGEMHRLFTDCPRLVLVDIVHEWLHVELDTILYQRWERGAVLGEAGRDKEGGKGLEPRLLTRAQVREGRF